MLASAPLSSRPLTSSPRLPRSFTVSAIDGEYGWAAWSYSRQAKLNAWAWHGVGALDNVVNWATLGSAIYMRSESDDAVYMMQPDTFLRDGEENVESTGVEATTQWLDFGKPGRMKALTGIDVDCQNVESVEIYVSAGGNREGHLSETVAIGSNQDGWTYSGDVIPLESAGTEFMLRFIGAAGAEVQVNRLSLHWDELQG
jgi:hypothetical protein